MPGKSLAILSGQNQGSLSGLKDLVFVSFRKSFQDIVPATISSWIKQTVVLCYQLSDEEAHTLHQVRAQDVSPLQPPRRSKAGSP